MKKIIVLIMLLLCFLFLFPSQLFPQVRAEDCDSSCSGIVTYAIKVGGVVIWEIELTPTYNYTYNKCCVSYSITSALAEAIKLLPIAQDRKDTLLAITELCKGDSNHFFIVAVPGISIKGLPDPQHNCPPGFRCNLSDHTCVEEEPIFKPEDCEVDGEEGIQTALGCFPTNPQEIVDWILKYSIMSAGGIGFLIMLWASFQIMTSQGDPEKLKKGQELLVSAIVGILIIVFALFLLRFIGWDILRIPGWN